MYFVQVKLDVLWALEKSLAGHFFKKCNWVDRQTYKIKKNIKQKLEL